MKFVSGVLRLIAATAAGAACLTTAAQADAVSDFYAATTVKLIVASGPGGGYDTYARSLLPFLQKHIPGKPNIIIQHVPGAGGLQAANFAYSIAPKDGSVILAALRETIIEPILGNTNAEFNASKFGWIGSLNSEEAICGAWHTAKVKTFKDLMTTELIVAGNGPNSTEYIPAIMNNTIGTKFKLIQGYRDGTATDLAVERGEVEGWCGWSYSSLESSHPDWLRDQKINVLLQASPQRNPKLPGVPMITDVAPNDDVKQMMELLIAPQYTGRPYAAPPGLPADRLAALRAAFDASTRDPEFIAILEKGRRPFSPVSGTEIQTIAEKIYATPPHLLARVRELVKIRQ
jgi:tripartite-type tricarboxylate transporter receptor subunit TctC